MFTFLDKKPKQQLVVEEDDSIGTESHKALYPIKKTNIWPRYIKMSKDKREIIEFINTPSYLKSFDDHPKVIDRELVIFLRDFRKRIRRVLRKYNTTVAPIGLKGLKGSSRLFYCGFTDTKKPSIEFFGRHRTIISYVINDNDDMYVIYLIYYAHTQEDRMGFVNLNELIKYENMLDEPNFIRLIEDKIGEFTYVTHNVQ
jgi:hypothetical protein